MKKYVFVDAAGQPAYTASPASDTAYTAGDTYGPYTCVEAPNDVDDGVILRTWYWKDGVQKLRPEQPSSQHEWDADTEAWVLSDDPDAELWDDAVGNDLPPRPAQHYRWDGPAATWVEDIALAKEIMRDRWNVWRDRELVAGFNGYHSDETFMQELLLASYGYAKGLLTGAIDVRMLDNSITSLPLADVDLLLLQLGQRKQTIYAQSWAGKDAAQAATTVDAVLACVPPA